MKKLIKKKYLKIILSLIILVISAIFYYLTGGLKQVKFTAPDNYHEADYVNEYCEGKIEYRLPDKTRVDCLTDEYAIEFD